MSWQNSRRDRDRRSSSRRARERQEAAAAAKAKAAAEAKAAETSRREGVLANVDKSTVSGRIQAQGGAAGFDDARTQDLIKGAQFGESVLGPDGLGRMGVDPAQAAIEAQAKELSQGYSSAESLARQEKGMEGIQGTTQAQSRAAQAQMARSGVKGQAAGFNLAQISASGVQARGNLERDLMIENRAAQERGLAGYGEAVKMRQEQEKFDIGQAAKEKDIALQAGLGFAQMGSTERGAAAAAKAQVASARAGRAKSCFAEGTKIKMANGSLKNIEDIKLGDCLHLGGIVYGMQQGLTDQIYKYKDVLITGSHAVFEKEWVRVANSPYAELEEGIYKVYNLSTSDHRIITEKDFMFADFDETDYGSKISDKDSLEELNGKRVKVLEDRRRT